MNIEELIARHEGRRNRLYKDSMGLWTIGIGRLIDPTAGGQLSDDEVDYLFANDLKRASALCEKYSYFTNLSAARKAACVDLMFNLGPKRYATFERFNQAMTAGNWSQAAAELRSSLWFTQVGRRGPEIINLIEHEVWPI